MMNLPHHTGTVSDAIGSYDSRYLLGLVHFNRGEYFEAHEVWEELWMDCLAVDRRFYQSLIQAAVSLYHWGNGNRAGAVRLFDSGRRYMSPYRPTHKGLDVDGFWGQVEAALALAFAQPSPPAPNGPPDSLPGVHEAVPVAPRIDLNPAPDRWPVPEPHNLHPTPGAIHE